MRISTAGRYGLRLMLDLALNGKEHPQMRQEIADRQQISAEYLAQLARPLVKHGLVDSSMGPGGGYRLARQPAEISTGDIFRAVEGPVAAVSCVLEETDSACPRSEVCAAHVLWSRLSNTIETFLDSVTLADLCEVSEHLAASGSTACDATVDTLILTVGDLAPAARICPARNSSTHKEGEAKD
jgi:Rrf2 family transcriptional regulator, iron-sulfur cluster assembly transcription factor